ncbi:hypothetical protein SERLA73DRAFT_176858 [Serpula lacrymans var. lacrymans S7.3]|uniref:Chromatin target of PRMT1 protein C-terminal domain-containing protein n=2 Tax=Serpula lacrymans var. lacrymans TaxID=341189 RepID=F8PQC2_SERL3|nr:uncharacterized protein SERLADRAFT_460149 [Serpula lacrymans var. lacrymans S7.9]EGO01535.1 hypothetical protein SERLA73DRAFT_176858 [Serpula lacrymans var. lacrymans S7.3]EGO27189.1 hypothetical protein SERLADRAFT_460149 [Serpula lacrymans var. lacrymans S7.9]
MENFPDGGADTTDLATLSYNDDVPYEEQIPTHSSNDPGRAALLDRIGNTKVYVLSESAAERVAKRKRTADEEDNDVEMEEDLSLRTNALLLTGPPISSLPTARLFAYATHFDAHPIALEWLNDNTCILVFESQTSARKAHRYLQKSAVEEPDVEGFITAKSIPIPIWPPEERINKSLGKGEGLKGTIRMRWAKGDDVKKKGAKKESEFYKKYGTDAGKDTESGAGPVKRRRQDAAEVETQKKAELDDDLDAFLSEGRPSSPPSKMRSDYIDTGRKSLLERTSFMRAHFDEREGRPTAPLPTRSRGHLTNRLSSPKWGEEEGRDVDRGKGRGRRGERPKKSQQELDDELEAFLKEKD